MPKKNKSCECGKLIWSCSEMCNSCSAKARPRKPLSEQHKKKLSELNSKENHPQYGKVKSLETRRKLSEANKGKSSPNKGKLMSLEQKRKLSIAHKGKKLSTEHKHKIGESNKGRVVSLLTRLKISERESGKEISQETRERIKKARSVQILPKKDSAPERRVQSFLYDLGVEFVKHKVIDIPHRYQCDVFIPSMNLVVECDGDYFHGNPDYFPVLTQRQILQRERDAFRNKELVEAGYSVLRLWETDINRMSVNEFNNRIKNLRPLISCVVGGNQYGV